MIKYLGRVLPRSGRDPDAAAALLEDLADRALRSEFEPVVCLEAPEAVDVPRSLRRADGRSIYQRHGGVRYATAAQLAMEERMLAQARAGGAPPGGLLVRRALDADPATGQRRWTDQRFLFTDFADTELGYAVTDHVAQGRTVHIGLAVVSGTEDRQHAYVALTRGTDTNMAYVFTVSPKLADPAPGPRPAPELARYDRITAGPALAPGPAAAGTGTENPLAVLANVLEHDGEQLSAAQIRQLSVVDADHLAFLYTIWAAETAPAREQRYRELLAAALPPGYRQEPGHQAKWLWRTLRAAELAGLDAGQVLADAVGERDLTGAREVPSVIDARLRSRTGALIPRPVGPWSAQLPEIADPERRAFAAQIAALMDERKERIGEHAAQHSLPWAVNALGPVPGDQPGRVQWRRRAASVGAWRDCPGTRIPPTRSGLNRPAATRIPGRPGTRLWPRSARWTGRTCAA